jgi:hypothetical protein
MGQIRNHPASTLKDSLQMKKSYGQDKLNALATLQDDYDYPKMESSPPAEQLQTKEVVVRPGYTAYMLADRHELEEQFHNMLNEIQRAEGLYGAKITIAIQTRVNQRWEEIMPGVSQIIATARKMRACFKIGR